MAILNKIIVLSTTLGRIVLPYITLLLPARKYQIIAVIIDFGLVTAFNIFSSTKAAASIWLSR